jgi:hypothetical protein
MNRGEAAGATALLTLLTFVIYYAVLYFFVFEIFLIITRQIGYDFYTVEESLWWLFIGFGFIINIRAATKSYKWTRRDYCNHCGEELKKN